MNNIYNDMGKKTIFTAGNIEKFVMNKKTKTK